MRLRTVIVDDHEGMGWCVAARIAQVGRERAAADRSAVLGLATGSTPIGVHPELIRMHREEGLDARNKATAAELDRPGLAESFAMEAYVVE